MRGTIETITTKTGTNSKGPWKKWGVKTENGWLSTFDKAIGMGLKEGQTYNFEVEKKGDFLTITEAVKITSIGGPSDTATTREPDPLDAELAGKPKPVAPTQKSNGDDKDRQIARAVALKAAVEHPEVPVATIIARAEELEKWLLR